MYRRKKFLVKSLQLKYGLLIILVFIVALLLIEWHLYLALNVIFPKMVMKEISQDLLYVQYMLMIKVGIVMLIAFLVTIYFTHRIAGPIFKIEKQLNEVKPDELLNLQINLRENDELKGFADSFNNFIKIVKEKYGN
ncbi:MAG: hypothetical protein AB1349_00705 [Elusimicrobiota bacterium]